MCFHHTFCDTKCGAVALFYRIVLVFEIHFVDVAVTGAGGIGDVKTSVGDTRTNLITLQCINGILQDFSTILIGLNVDGAMLRKDLCAQHDKK